MRFAMITSRRRGSTRAIRPRSASRSTASSQARASMHAVIWSTMSTLSTTSRAVPASKRVTSMRFSTRLFSRRVSLTTSRTAGSIIGSTLPVSASSSSSSTSVTAVIAVSGVRSSCDMSATNRRDACSRALMSSTRFSSDSAVRLNVRDRSASSSVPDTRSRVSSLPSPSRRAAVPRRCTGFSTVVAAACASSAEPISASPVAIPSDQARELRSLASGSSDLSMYPVGPPPITFAPPTRYGLSPWTIRCQYRWYVYLLFEEISCSLFTAFWRDFGTSPSVKVSRSEFPRTVLPFSSSAISSTLKRWLLFAICPAARCSSPCVGCGRSALARVCIACWKSPSTASCVRVSTASRLSQYAIPDADTAAVSATSPNTTTRRSRRLVKRRPASIVLRAAAQPRSLSCGFVTEDCPAGSRLPEPYGSGWERTARPPPSRAAAAHASTSRESPR